MITFRDFLKKKFSEVNVDPQLLTKTIGTMINAPQPASPASVGTTLATANPQLAAAVGGDPKTQKLLSIVTAKKNKANPQLQNVNTLLPPNIGTTLSSPGMT